MEKENYIVYLHTVPKEISGYDYDKYYVGITGTKPETRWGKNGYGYKNCVLFWRAIQKYGWDNIKHEILYSNLTKEEAGKKEVSLIAELNTTGKYGYNIAKGGTGGNNKEIIAVNQYSLDGKYIATFDSAAEAARYLTQETGNTCHRTSISSCCTGYYKKAYGYMWRYRDGGTDDIAPYQRATQKYVIQYDMKGHYINKYVSIKEASRKTGICAATISQVCNKKPWVLSAGGYLWSFEGETPRTQNLNVVQIYAYDTNKRFIGVYKSITQASKDLKVNAAMICTKKILGNYVNKNIIFILGR